MRPRTDAYGAERADGFGVRPGAGAADRFGNADPFGDGQSYGNGRSSGEPESFGEPESSGDTSSAEIGAARSADAAGGKGFLNALFDFGFTSFVTPKVVKALYMLITIGTVVSALVFTIIAFKASVAFGVATLVIGDPLFILIVLAIYRVIWSFSWSPSEWPKISGRCASAATWAEGWRAGRRPSPAGVCPNHHRG